MYIFESEKFKISRNKIGKRMKTKFSQEIRRAFKIILLKRKSYIFVNPKLEN